METFRLEPAPGASIEVDHLAGRNPGWIYLHGLGSVRAGEKSSVLFGHARRTGRAATRFDFRGHGASSGRFGRVTGTEKLQDTAAVLRRTGPSVLFGSSMGGMIAAWAAARHQDLVQGMVLLCPAFGFMGRMPELPDGADTVLYRGEYELHRSVFEDALQYDESTLAARLGMPILLVHGTADDVIPLASSEAFFAALPSDRKEFLRIEGGDHRLNEPIAEIVTAAEDFFVRHGVF